ncbi:cupin domain-containing protein [Azospirillum halopraeferens]|uniref:cupin domain-containing protein n=1 Tax=Azospirillum halopraeferens TaxID=34010 RepID=UPI0003FA0F31|nr:cupin domain-containing protein [Azospirillum halopraeferens]
MTIRADNLLRDLPAARPAGVPDELFTTLAEGGGARVERIVSTGQASPDGFWYDQGWAELVLVVQGSAGLRIEADADVRTLGPGDWVMIPAGARHRVEWTQTDPPTVWLAVHFPPDGR